MIVQAVYSGQLRQLEEEGQQEGEKQAPQRTDPEIVADQHPERNGKKHVEQDLEDGALF
ncbi:hypothetical protein D3C76_1709290 [compost metagenome]